MIIEQKKRPGPKPGPTRPVRPTLHRGGRGPRPLIWSTGPDPRRHEMFKAYGKARAQANFRGEPWLITFEDYERVWADQWERRGRTRDTLCLSRIDYDLGWEPSNIEVITRREHNQRQADWRVAHR